MWPSIGLSSIKSSPTKIGSSFKTSIIMIIDFSDPADFARHDSLVSLVERMLALHKQLHEVGTSHERAARQRLIEATDGQIDGARLYALTVEEIGIVEDSDKH